MNWKSKPLFGDLREEMNDPVTRRLSAQLSSGIGDDWWGSTDSGIVETKKARKFHTPFIDWLIDLCARVCFVGTQAWACVYLVETKGLSQLSFFGFETFVAGVPSTCRCTKFCCVCLLVVTWGLGLQTGSCACKPILFLLSYFHHPGFSSTMDKKQWVILPGLCEGWIGKLSLPATPGGWCWWPSILTAGIINLVAESHSCL